MAEKGKLNLLSIPAGARILIGAPSHPMSSERLERIRGALERVSGVSEAHIPLVFVKGKLDPPSQVLFVVLSSSQDPAETMDQLGRELSSVTPDGEYLDVIPIEESSPLLKPVRSSRCSLTGPSEELRPRAWWKLW